MKKVTVYVKHYLTPLGLDFLRQKWFPRVESLIRQQKGFIFITCCIEGDCANLSLQFEDDKSFDAWVAHPEHDGLVNALDAYRGRTYWEVVRTTDEAADPSMLVWTVIDKMGPAEIDLSKR